MFEANGLKLCFHVVITSEAPPTLNVIGWSVFANNATINL
jgi:hypothetical protein